jgi:hypothetical protein
MKLLPWCGAALIAATAMAADPSTPALPVSHPEQRIALWNGRDLAGWRVFLKDPAVDPRRVWSVQDGVLRLMGQPYGYLRSTYNYFNYHLHAQWRWPAGNPKNNSGLFVHVNGPDAIWPECVECQIKTGSTGDLIGTGISFPAPVINKKWRALVTTPSAEKAAGEWNDYDILCRGDVVETFVNGVYRNRVQPVSVVAGAIALQLEGTPVEFRDLWLEPVR